MATKTKRPTFQSVDEYIAALPAEVQEVLQKIRKTIRDAVPEAEEKISYGIPAFALNGRAFTHFAGFKEHVSVFPAPRAVAEFKKALAQYKGGKGTIQLPLDLPLPTELIERIARFRAEESRKRGVSKAKPRKKARAKSKSKTRAKVKTKARAKTATRTKRKAKAKAKTRSR